MVKRLLPVLLGLCLPLLLAAPALAAAPEAPETLNPGPVDATEATLHGILNPNATAPSEAGTYEFLYKKASPTCEGESKAPASPGVSLGIEHEAVSEPVQGLTRDTEYTVCLLARNSKGEATVGPPVTFTTTEGFGLQSLEVSAVNQNGSPDVQAGSHPYALTTSFVVNKPEEFEMTARVFGLAVTV